MLPHPTYTDLDPQGNDRIPFRERLQAKIVEPLESEAVAVIGLGLMCDEFRLREMLDQLEGTTALEACVRVWRWFTSSAMGRG